MPYNFGPVELVLVLILVVLIIAGYAIFRFSRRNKAQISGSMRPHDLPEPALYVTSNNRAGSAMGISKIDVFLSYSRKDSEAMRRLRAELTKAALTVWTDEALEAGTPIWQQAIEDAIRQARSMVVLMSPAAKASEWVNIETAVAKRCKVRIFPILIAGDEASAIPFSLATTQFVDLRQDHIGAVHQKLLPALFHYLGRP